MEMIDRVIRWGVSIPWLQLLMALGIFLLFLLFRKIFTRYVFKVILAFSQKTHVSLFTQLLLSYKKPMRLFFVIIGVDVALRSMHIVVTGHPIYKASLIILLGWGLYEYVSTHGTFMAFAQRKFNVAKEHMIIPFVSNVLRFAVIALTVVAVLASFGVDINGFVAGLGLGGLAFALAAQETVANFFGGIVIITEKPFKKGDWIKTASVEGVVEDITFRSTRVRTFADTLVTVPNKTLSNEAITNYSEMGMRRVDMTIGVGQDATRAALEQSVKAIRQVILTHPGVVSDTVMVHFDAFGESSYNIFVYYFTKTVAWTEWLTIKEEINFAVLDILTEEGVSVLRPIALHQKEHTEERDSAR
ncbi:mechanosensitive ion channel family protein [Shouchella lonarensis]|uniref:MscS family membrane protein n=1 Tax=Shouchella lonarensis TaxID=1464122 RepID=A0A1G6IQP6_9BACI|nr:mechanosensitive ion channel family protein [Shouchella lonarensis]SDC08892.1 MscS family membrane protein [Shouchella lonarensis]